MKKFTFILCLLPTMLFSQTTELFFSEYGEGSGLNKYLEIYNGTGADVDLSTYSIKLYNNGAATPNATLALSGTIVNGTTFTIVHASSTDPTLTAAADMTNASVVTFNGDDALELLNTGVVIDAIGIVGTDPGTAWTVAGNTGGGLNHTLIRFSGVCSPNTDWTAAAGTGPSDSEWTVMSIDDFSNVGMHTAYCDVLSCPAAPAAPATSGDVAVCMGATTTLTGTTTLPGTHIEWYDQAVGGTLVFTGNSVTTGAINANVTYYAEEIVPNCPAGGNRTALTITANSLPAVSGGSDQTVCAGASVTLSGSGATSYTWDNGVTDGVAFSAAATTTYTVTGIDGNGCQNTATVTVTVNTIGTVDAGLDQTVCAGDMVTLSGSGVVSYTWDNGVTDGVAFAATATTTYTVTGTDAGGCQGTDQVIVTVNALPAVNAGSDVAVCTGTSVTLSASGATSYSWDNGVSDGVAFTPASTLTYTVTGTDGNGCINTDQVVVTVNALPTVSAGADVAVCTGSSVTLSGSGATSYSWNFGVSNGVAFVPASSLTYTVTGTDGNGCINTDQVAVTVNALPIVNAGADQTLCSGSSVTLSGSGAVSYSWDNGVIDGFSFDAFSTLTYTVTGTDGNSCSNTDQVTITVNALPAVNAGSDQVVCFGTAVTLSGSGATSYSWDNSVSDGVAFTPSSTLIYTLTGTDGNGCSNIDDVIVTVNSLPTVSAGADQSVCAGTTVTLSGSGAGILSWDNGVSNNVAFLPLSTQTYTVTGTDGNGCSNTDQVIVSVNALPNVNAGIDQSVCTGTSLALSGAGATMYSWDNGVTDGVAFTPASTATYTVTGTDGNGCTDTDQITVTVIAAPVVDAGADQTVCVGSSITLSGSGASSYSWDNGVSDGVAFMATTTTTYTVTGIGAGGCSNTDVVTVTVNALPTIDAGADQTVCAGVSVTLMGNGAVSYTWDNGVTNGVSFNPSATASYIVTGTDGNGCQNSDMVTVNVNALPVVSAGADQSICSGASITLSGSGAMTYSWDNGVSNGLAFSPSTTATYTVSGTDGNGCINSDQVTVTVNATPVFSASATNPSACATADGSILVQGSVSGDLSWTGTASGSQNGVLLPFIINNLMAGSYTINFVSAAGCSASAITQTLTDPGAPAAPIITAGGATSFCPGGSVVLTSSETTGITWSTGETTSSITVSATGSYTVSFTVAGCTSNSSAVDVVVLAAPSIAVGATSNPSVCSAADGSIEILGSGTGTVNWSGTASGSQSGVTLPFVITGLASGTYTATFAGSCSSNSVFASITDPGAPATPTISANGALSFCPGGSVTLTSSNASGNTWSDGQTTQAITVSAAGNYFVTTTSGACSASSAAVSVNVFSLPAVTAGADQTVCAGTMVTLNGAGANTYSWDNGVSDGVAFGASTTTTYTVSGTDGNGCSASDQVVVTVNALPVVTIDPVGLACSDIGPALTLVGSPAGGTFSGTNVTGTTFDPIGLATGNYTISYAVTDGNGCTGSASQVVAVDICSGIAENNFIAINVFPNPAHTGMLQLESEQLALFDYVSLKDQLGRTIIPMQALAGSAHQLNVSQLATGTYFLVVTGEENQQTYRIEVINQ